MNKKVAKKQPQVDVDAIVSDSFQSDPSYPEVSKYGTDPAYPKRPMHQAPQTYYDAPFEHTPMNMRESYVSENNPYKIDPGVSSPLGVSPMERLQMEEAIKKALGNAAGQGAAAGNAVKFRK